MPPGLHPRLRTGLTLPPVLPTAGVPQGVQFVRGRGAPRSSYCGGTPGDAFLTGVGRPPSCGDSADPSFVRLPWFLRDTFPHHELKHLVRRDALKRFRYAAGLSAPAYLIALFLSRERVPGGIPFLMLTVIGPLAATYFCVTYLLARKRDDRIPDPLPFLAWGSAAAMEIHAFAPPAARTGVVPAALFFGLALKFPPTLSIPAILCIDAWLAAVPGPIEREILYTSAMALVAGGAGIVVRRGYRDEVQKNRQGRSGHDCYSGEAGPGDGCFE